MATKSKSRIARVGLHKKNQLPIWVIAVVTLVVASVGGFLIYRSFAFPSSQVIGEVLYTKVNVHCNSGACRQLPFAGSELHTVFIRRTDTGRYGPFDSCGSGLPPFRYREARFVQGPDNVPLGGITMGNIGTSGNAKRRTPVGSDVRADVCLEVPRGTIIPL